jgi:hypothetical protein
MKISSIALAAAILLSSSTTTTTTTTTQAFVPVGRTTFTSRHAAGVVVGRGTAITSSSTTTTKLYTATSPSSIETVQKQLNLDYPPISPFGCSSSSSTTTTTTVVDKHILGGKGANLAEMSAIGLSVPPGFTITTEICDKFCNAWNSDIPSELWQQIVSSLSLVETEMGSQFGSSTNPLLLSVRSGAAISMPGMVSKKDVKKECRWGQGTTFCVV